MSNLAGVRRRRSAPVVLVSCPSSSLAVGSWVVVEADEGARASAYLAEVVFGPRDVVSSTGCAPAGRVIRPAADDELAAAPGRARPGVHHEAGAAPPSPLWIGVAPPGEASREDGPSRRRPPTAEMAREAAELLAIVAEGRYGVRGFDAELPALGAEVALSSGGTAVVTGIDGKRGRLHARLPDGQPVTGPLPVGAGDLWTPTADGEEETAAAESGRPGGRGRRGKGGREQ